MAQALETCDAFVSYLTESSLYLNRPNGTPRPAIDNELIPAIARWRRAQSGTPRADQPPAPVVTALTHGLGDPRKEAPDRVRRATGEDISSLWTPVVLDQNTERITQAEAAAVTGNLINTVLGPDRRRPAPDPIEMLVVTRGTGQPAEFLTVDATALVGGGTNQPGSSQNWRRYLGGIRDLEAALSRWATHRHLRVTAKAHLTGCVALGRIFNQAAGWRIEALGRHGFTSLPPDANGDTNLEITMDHVGGPDDLVVELDLLNTNMTTLVTGLLRNLDGPPCGRLHVRRQGESDLRPSEVGAMAAHSAATIRLAVSEHRPTRTHIFCATPGEFAVLVGHRLTSLHSDLYLYERDGECYVPSLVVPSSTP
jgi:hypothetical protein